ncbi:MAG: regulatory protein RecX, partial [Dehalococcoidia bacterium]
QPTLLPVDTVVLHHLREGNHLPPEEWRAVTAEGQQLLAVRKALEILARRQKTEHELRTALARSFDATAIEAAVERMRSLGYLNDEAWARNYVASGRAAERGRALLRHELGQHGVPDPLVVTAIEEHDDRAAALAAARKRMRSLRHLDESKRSKRLYDFLRRRGFSSSISRDAMTDVLAADETLDGLEDADPA